MKLAGIILKIQEQYSLTDHEDYQNLSKKVDSWEKRCHLEDADKIQKWYHKLHKGIFFELLAPFFFVYLKRWFDMMLNGDDKSERDDYID